MRKVSFLRQEFASLSRQYGEENVLVPDTMDCLLIRNFPLPAGYKLDRTMLFIRIPEGYGYGSEILESWVLLSKRVPYSHLVHLRDQEVLDDIQEKLATEIPKRDLRRREWYWICAHLWGTCEYDHQTKEASVKSKGARILQEKLDPASRTVGIVEFQSIVRYILQFLAVRDKKLNAILAKIGEERSRIRSEAKKEAQSWTLAQGWRELPWPL